MSIIITPNKKVLFPFTTGVSALGISLVPVVVVVLGRFWFVWVVFGLFVVEFDLVVPGDAIPGLPGVLGFVE